jgi:hypothetical protein
MEAGVERIEVCCICTYKDSILKPTKHCLEGEKEEEGENENLMEEVDLFKVHYMHL